MAPAPNIKEDNKPREAWHGCQHHGFALARKGERPVQTRSML